MKEQRRLKLSGIQVGITGEYLVAAERSGRAFAPRLCCYANASQHSRDRHPRLKFRCHSIGRHPS